MPGHIFLKEKVMKKNLIAVAVLAVSAISSPAFAADGTVNFTGSITDIACTVDTTSLNQTVDLGKVSKTAFTAGSKTAGAKDFALILKNCPETVTSARVRFDGQQVPGDNSVLALNNVPDKASNLGIQLTDTQNNVINLYQNSAVYKLTKDVNTLKFVAKYYATGTGNDVGVGSANAVTDFTIIYP
jgi:major type 1 subunit fimbrin (pilin)